MSTRLAYKDFESQEAVVAECRRRIDGWRVPHELRVVQTTLGPATVDVIRLPLSGDIVWVPNDGAVFTPENDLGPCCG